MAKKSFYKKEGFIEAGTYGGQQKGYIYFYNSYIDAFNEAIQHSPNDFEIKGKLEDISDMPVILKTLMNSSNAISYNESDEILTIKNMMDKEWASLCTLFKNKPFEIKLLSFDDVKDCEQWAYESM